MSLNSLVKYFQEVKESVDLGRLFRAGLSPFEMFRSQGRNRPTNYDALMKRYKDWVYICASKNASSVAQVPLRLYVTTSNGQRKPKNWVHRKALSKEQAEYIWKNDSLARYTRKAVNIEEVLDHPFLTLWYAPNPHSVGFTFRELITIDQEMVGDSFVYIYMDNALGIPTEFVRLPPQWTAIVPDPETFIKGYLYGRSRLNRVALDPENVIHFKYPNPRDPFYGMSPVEGSLSAVDIDDSMSKYDLKIMDNEGRPDFVVSYKGKLTPGKAERLKKEWKRLYGGKTNVGRPAFLDQEAEIQTLGWSPKEMAHLAGRKWSMKLIANAHGVPIPKIDVDNVNRANADAGNYQYMKDTIYPRCIRQQETLNQNVVRKYDERLFVAYDNPVPEDKEFRLKEKESNLKSAYSSINQERQIDNLEPVEWGDKPWVQAGMVPIGTPPSMLAVQQPKGRAMVGYAKRQDVPIDRPEPPVGTLPPMDEDEKKFERLIRRILSEQEKDVLRGLEKIYITDEVSEEFINFLKGADDAVLNRQVWDEKVAKAITPQVSAKVDVAGNSALGQVDVVVAEWIERPETIQWIQDHTFQFAKQINGTVETMLKESLSLGIQAGESIPAFRKRIQEVFNLRRSQAERIARTEMNRAANGGTVEAWKQSGIVTEVIWDAANDACPFCYQMHGTVVALDGTFISGGEDAIGYVDDSQVRLPMNYGDVHHPPLHPNCRCTLIPRVKEIE